MARIAPKIVLGSVQKSELHGWVQAPSTPQSLALRARVVLRASKGESNQRIALGLGLPQITVSKWRRRFAAQGLDGLRDAPRSGRPVKHGPEVWQRVQHRVCQQPKFQSRWSVRTLAREVGLPSSTVHSMLRASGLQPHRLRTFTFSPDPDFEAKSLDIVGLYLNPPEKALVLCVDEKTGIQALDRTQPLLPLRAKQPRSWTNEYVRHGSHTLLAALEIATGRVLGEVKRRTSVNFLRFMSQVVGHFPQRELHVILDNLNIHKGAAAQRWLGRHPQVHFHHTPTHASWVNLAECFFSLLTRRGLQQSVHRSRRDLKEYHLHFIDHYNQTSSPFVWTKGPEQLQRIIEATRDYQTTHPRKPRRRRKKNNINN
jgi:transposase